MAYYAPYSGQMVDERAQEESHKYCPGAIENAIFRNTQFYQPSGNEPEYFILYRKAETAPALLINIIAS